MLSPHEFDSSRYADNRCASLYDFNGLYANTIFCFWTGDEAMSDNRVQALWSILQNCGCALAFINKNTLFDWVLPDRPLHPAYEYLSSTHKSDYLRCYFMHHYGGGYTDLKITTKSWSKFFDILKNSNSIGLGYPELEHGIPHLADMPQYINISYKSLIGLCAFIFKRRTSFTHRWFNATETLLSNKYPLLAKHPAQHPLDRNGVVLPNGEYSKYPLRWAELLGEIFHPLANEYEGNILKYSIEPYFSGYR